MAQTELSGAFAALSGRMVKGYEIHMGHSEKRQEGREEAGKRKDAEVFLNLQGEAAESGKAAFAPDGFCSGNVLGTYLHGLFDEEEFRTAFLSVIC